MHHFRYRNGILHAEDVDVREIAAAVGTPFYCYATATIERHYRVFAEAFTEFDPLICYSIKANSNQAVIATLARLGAGMDVVSEGELRRALAAGVAPDKIIFSGVGKTRAEMAAALDAGILSFNVESEPELHALAEVAAGRNRRARVSLRINPDVDPHTHEKISTGRAEHKFGIPYDEAPRLYGIAAGLEGLEVWGVHMHIGSQISELAPFERAFGLMRALIVALRAEGHDIRHADLGGGLGVPYRKDEPDPPHPSDYARIVEQALGDLDLQLALEPGRLITGNAGILVTRVLYNKPVDGKHFLIVDAAMNDLMRPTLYDAHHEIWPIAEEANAGPMRPTDVVGPVCETGDYLARGRLLPALPEGALLAVMTAGAYGAVQSGTYNSRPLVPEVLVRGGKFAVVRPRPSHEDLIALDHLPPWLSSGD